MDLNGKKVLVVRLSALGDVIRTIPAVQSLKQAYPQMSLTWLVEDASAGFMSALKDIEMIPLSRKTMRSKSPFVVLNELRRVVREIKKRQFDISIDFHGVAKSAMLPWLAGIPQRFGFLPPGSKEQAHWLYSRKIPHQSARVSRYQRNMELSRSFCEDLQLENWLVPVLEPEDTISGLMSECPVLLVPGTSLHGRNKQWPAENWAYVYDQLKERKLPVLFVFGPADSHYREALEKACSHDVEALPPLKLPQLGFALTKAKLVVACDTGPMHLASILQVPILALMGPSDPVLNQPLMGNEGHPLTRMLIPDVPCAPCRNRKCAELICQAFTKPAQVLEMIIQVAEVAE